MLDLIVDRFSWGKALISFCVLYFIFFWIRDFVWKRKIASLGYHAPKIQTWPFGVDFVYRGIQANLHYRNLEFWSSMFWAANCDSKGTGAHTVEVTIAGKHRVVFTASPENTKAILTGQFADYGKGQQFHEEWEPFLGDSIFATDGEKWQFARQLLRPMFSRERVADLDSFEHHMQKLIPLLGSGDGAAVDVTKCFFRFTLDAATDFLLGAPVGSLDNEDNQFAKWFGNIQHIHSLISRAGPMKVMVAKGSYWQDLRQLENFLNPIITQVLAMSPEELDHKLSKSDTFLHQLARATRDPKVIRDQLVAILLAGRDTTACTLSWIFLELARHPEAQAKLRKEILEHLGSEGRRPTYADIKDMKYLTWVINETLRRYPVVPFNVRAALKDTTLPTGGGPDGTLPIGIRQGTPIGYSPLYMQRRRDLYPPVSETFPYHPDEWAPDRWATWTPKAWTYIPFNGGPRICIGQQFAMVEMGYTICRILQQFDHVLDLGSKNQEILKCEIVLVPAEGIKLGFQKLGEKARQ